MYNPKGRMLLFIIIYIKWILGYYVGEILTITSKESLMLDGFSVGNKSPVISLLLLTFIRLICILHLRKSFHASF